MYKSILLLFAFLWHGGHCHVYCVCTLFTLNSSEEEKQEWIKVTVTPSVLRIMLLYGGYTVCVAYYIQ